MKSSLFAVGVLLSMSAVLAGQESPKVLPLADGLTNPESVAVTADGKVYVSQIGQFGTDGDGSIVAILPGKTEPLVDGLDDPKGLAAGDGFLLVTDKTCVWKVGLKQGRKTLMAGAEAFPAVPRFLNDIALSNDGVAYVSDSGTPEGEGAAVYRIAADGTVSLVADPTTAAGMQRPNGLLPDGPNHLLVLDFGSGKLLRVALADGSATQLAEGFAGGDGLARDDDGNLYVSQWTTGKVWLLRNGRGPAQLWAEGFQSAADICLGNRGHILVPDMKAGTLSTVSLPSNNPSGVDTSPLEVKIVQSFSELEVARPIVLTHAGDGSGRIFVASQLGKVYVLPAGSQGDRAEVFIDLEPQVEYRDRENEEGLLGLAFHPRYRDNGEFFVYYTTREVPHTSIVSRFKVSPDNPNRALVESEEELLRIEQPFWNHNGGTIVFGPDGYLYIALGDGGSANDPHGNGQNLQTWLGSILRIDVDRRSGDKPYGIPADNPFVERDDAQPEIYAYGVRNIWRLTFDRETGTGWAADVGQNIWEEINLLERGGNYGWKLRESMHRFTAAGSPPRDDLIEPIWEYHHDIGRSVTGGHVYRGNQAPALTGKYLYADYVTGQVWALQYDPASKRVTANHPINGNVQPVMSFGEDEQGEVYFLTSNGPIYRFAP